MDKLIKKYLEYIWSMKIINKLYEKQKQSSVMVMSIETFNDENKNPMH